MRTSKRAKVLDAAVAVVERDGVTALTFDSVAAQSGLTKGGLLYHFSTKEDLVIALHEHLAQRWEADLVAVLGTDPETATVDQRLAAYAQVSVRSASGPELLLMLEASSDPVLLRPWQDVIQRWVPDLAAIDQDNPDDVTRVLVWLAADGLWLSDSMAGLSLPANLRVVLANRITAMLKLSE